ncbi:hypothetical protein LXT21_05030 [Myxococcus sp. K38C18041901]|uniref:hypothetical protein n=1 Tax=Myxococcus guangdongensis TaxID=2906760 RepID=UPI0020A78B70|nr:hypothetical protein [Myxococcus guangdongensis]MCP3058123.1 hypothetical protein [Myxococcus guangdongensis]
MSIDKPSKSAARMGPRLATSRSTAPARPESPRPPSGKTDGSHPRRDKFEGLRQEGAGLPIRLSGQGPRKPPKGLPLRPWMPRTNLEPWNGTRQKPWVHSPDIFGTSASTRSASPCGCGLPVRLS